MTDASRASAEHAVLEAIDALAPAFDQAGLDELEVEVGEIRSRLARPRPESPAPAGAAPTPPPSLPARPDRPATAFNPFGEPAPGMRFVTAPLTGVWYASPLSGRASLCG